MTKKSLCFSLLATMSLAATTFAASPFSDVSSSHHYHDAIDYVKSQGIVSGYPDGSYGPKNTINRAEFTKIIIEAAYPGQAKGEKCFPDVKTEWFAKYVCFAQKKKVIAGYPDGTFGPTNKISFSEAAKIIVNAFGYQSGTHEVWYKPFVDVLGEKKAIPSAIAGFTHTVSRGEMAEMIYRLKAGVKTKKYHDYTTLSGGKAALEPLPIAKYKGAILAGSTTPFLDFTQADFDQARKDKKKIVLYFYASWCPTCKAELVHTHAAFNQLKDASVVGFRVNYKDSDTDDDEVALARAHGVSYQHTKVFLDESGERVKKAPDSWDTERYLKEIAEFSGQ